VRHLKRCVDYCGGSAKLENGQFKLVVRNSALLSAAAQLLCKVSLVSLYKLHVVYIYAALYNISTGTPASRCPSATAASWSSCCLLVSVVQPLQWQIYRKLSTINYPYPSVNVHCPVLPFQSTRACQCCAVTSVVVVIKFNGAR